MWYYGGKAKTAKYIAYIINEIRHYNNIQWIIEPFCGACNITYRLEGNIIASDNNPYLIAMWRAVQCGWIPPDIITEKQYNSIRQNIEKYPKELVGFIGNGCSFGGKWLSSYARATQGKRNCAIGNKKDVLKKACNMIKTIFIYTDYENVVIPTVPCLIYCDPPYYHKSAAGYYDKNWNHRRFYAWCDKMVKIGHIILISDSKAARAFIPIWSKTFNRALKGGINNNKDKSDTELLCIHKSQIDKVPIEILTGKFIENLKPKK